MSQQIVIMAPEELRRVITEAVREVAESLTPPPQGKRLLTTEEVAQEYGLNRRLLESWRSNGTGPPYTAVGKKLVRYEREGLEAWIARGRIKTTGDA